MEMRGECREVKPPERVVSSESWGPDWPETLNTVEDAPPGWPQNPTYGKPSTAPADG
jgi:hypothetical protein